MKKSKIAILHYSCWPVIGGVEVIISAHSKHFLANGFKVKIVAGRGKKFHPALEFIKIHHMDSMSSVNREISKQVLNGRKTSDFEKLETQIYMKLKQALKDSDTIIAHNLFTMHFNLPLSSALNKLAKEFKNKKFIAWTHDTTFSDPNYMERWKNTPCYNILTEFNPRIKYVAISKFMQENLSRLYKVNPSKIKVIPDGVDIKEFLALSDELLPIFDKYKLFNVDYVLFYPTRILKRKNIELALKIVYFLNKNLCKAYLIITGAPDTHNKDSMNYYKFLLSLVKKLNIKRYVVFLHEERNSRGDKLKVTDALLRSLYRLSDVLLFPTKREGFGIPVLEAGLCRIPTVISKIKPLTEIALESEVIYIDLKMKPSEITKRIHKKLKSSSQAALFKKVVSNYSWQAIFSKKILPLIK